MGFDPDPSKQAQEPFSKKCDIWCHKGYTDKNEKKSWMLHIPSVDEAFSDA